MGRLIALWTIVATLLLAAACTLLAHTATAADCVKAEWKVDGVRLPRDPTRAATSYVELGDIIAVQSSALPDLRKCASLHNPVVLFLNGVPMAGLLEYPPSNPASNEALYTLKISPQNRPLWTTLLGNPDIGGTKPVEVSLGLADGFPITPATIALRQVSLLRFAIWAVLFGITLICFFQLAHKSNLLRGGTPAGGRIFSIGRSQAAWWFFIVLASYLLIGLTTGDYTNSLNKTSLILLGIASGTYLGSAVIDAAKETPDLLGQQANEVARIEAIPRANRSPADIAKLAKLYGESQGWLLDILSTSEGIDFHRFQILVWSVVLGIVFITRVWQDLAMPEFDSTLLGLTGLSAATYMGLKIPEATS